MIQDTGPTRPTAYQGVEVIARSPALMKTPSGSLSSNRAVNELLMANESTMFECNNPACASDPYINISARSVMAHNKVHGKSAIARQLKAERERTAALDQIIGRRKDRAVVLATASRERREERVEEIREAGLVAALRSIRDQWAALGHYLTAVELVAIEVVRDAQRKPDVEITPQELETLRAKAGQFDALQNALGGVFDKVTLNGAKPRESRRADR